MSATAARWRRLFETICNKFYHLQDVMWIAEQYNHVTDVQRARYRRLSVMSRSLDWTYLEFANKDRARCRVVPGFWDHVDDAVFMARIARGARMVIRELVALRRELEAARGPDIVP